MEDTTSDTETEITETETIEDVDLEEQEEPIENMEAMEATIEVIENWDTALEIGKQCIEEIEKDTPSSLIDTSYEPPLELIESGPWQMSINALTTTLDYIFKKLHYSCYLLCITKSVPVLYKLENKTTAPFFDKVMRDEIAKLDKNKTMRPDQVNLIKNVVKGSQLRILQCIVKKISNETSVAKEYADLIQHLGSSLPNGVYILNLSDAVLLHKEGVEPFPIFRNNHRVSLTEEYKNKPFIPIFSISGQENYWDIPIPNYDDVMYIEGIAKYNIQDFNTDWTSKKAKAVFRGGPSGCGYTTETNARLKLTTLQSSDLDVGIVVKGKDTIDSNSIRFDPLYGLGMLNTGIKSVQPLTYQEQSNFKYIIHIDGNVNAYRLLSTMAMGSVILRVKSVYTSWFDHLLQPEVHYIPVKEDLSDLLQRIEWCKAHDQECRTIAQASLQFATMALTEEYIKGAFQKTFWSASSSAFISSSSSVPSSATVPATATATAVAQQKKKEDAIKRAKEKIGKKIEEERTKADALQEYYSLKQMYEEDILKKKMVIIKKEGLSWKEKRKEFHKLRPKCVNCKRPVGTIFDTTMDKLGNRYISAICGDRTKPCVLNIRIQLGTGDRLDESMEETQKILNRLKRDIIMEKNDTLFGYITNEEAVSTFEHIGEEYKKTNTFYEELQEIYDRIIHNPEKKKDLQEKEKVLYSNIDTLKTYMKDFDSTDKEKIKLVDDAVELYKTTIEPSAEAITNLKYNYIEVDKNAKDDTYHLIEKAYTIENVEFDNEYKVISFKK